MVPRAAIAAGNWECITQAASGAAALHVHRTP
jgi:hypothetical protein